MSKKIFLFYSSIIFLYILYNFLSGCSKPLLKSEKEEVPVYNDMKLTEEAKEDEKKEWLLNRYKLFSFDEIRFRYKLQKISEDLNSYQNINSGSAEHREKLQDKRYELTKEMKSLQTAYESLSIELSQIQNNLKNLNYKEDKLIEVKKEIEDEYVKIRKNMEGNVAGVSAGGFSSETEDAKTELNLKEGFTNQPAVISEKSSIPTSKGEIQESFESHEPSKDYSMDGSPETRTKGGQPEEVYYEDVWEIKGAGTPPVFEKSGLAPKKEYVMGSGLKAGYSDDNRQFNYFIDYLKRFQHVEHYPVDIGERIILNVIDISGKSIPNAEVTIFGNNDYICGGFTYSDGSYLFFPSEYGKNISKYNAVIKYMNTQKEVQIDRYGRREIEVKFDYQKNVKENVPMDILFIFDITGSMKEEIERLKTSLELIKLNIASIKLKPDIRFGMVFYRDRGDDFVTKVIPLTKDLNVFQEELNKVKAAGGGDGPEDLQSALKDAIQKIDWNKDGIRLSFIITDAPPHLDYGQRYTYINAAKDAKDKGIKIYSVGTGGLDNMGEYVLRQISQYTSAKYIFLTYGEKGESEGVGPGSVSHHTGANFETDKLEAIIIKIAKEELSNFTDEHIEEGEDYFIASRIESEKKEETLKKLFEMAASQLIDYSTYAIEDQTPAAVLCINSKDKDCSNTAEYFTEQLMLCLMKNKKFKMVERKDLQKAVNELALSMTGLIDEKNIVKVGQLIGARMLIYGDMYAKDGNFELFLKLMRVETSEILSVTKSKINFGLGL